MDNESTKTIDRTLWSETLIEMLIVALVTHKPDEQIKDLLTECKEKGFKINYLTEKIRKEINDVAASRVSKLMR